jgi:exosortase
MTPVGGLIQGTAGLQSRTATVIQWLSTVFGIPITVDGANIYSLDGRFETLEVAGGCSGIRSLMAMLTLAALYAYFMMRTPLRGMLLFVCSLIFAVLGNFARVFSVVLFARFIDPKIATGLYHDYSGFVFFPVAVLAMVGFGGLLNRDWEGWFHRRFNAPAPGPTVRPSQGQPVTADAIVPKPKPEEPRSSYDY